MSTLHPSQRTLKTEQIGPSSHKNEYHVGVLDGNWCEERHAFGRQAEGPQPFAGRASTRETFRPHTHAEYVAAVPSSHGTSEAPRTLLFGHGEPVHNLSTTAGASFVNTIGGNNNTVKGGEQPRTSLMEKKKQEWGSGMPHDGRYVTTKNVTVDASAEHAKQHFDYQPVKAAHHGQFLKSLGSVMRQTNFRSED